jgi:hypothetical protein
MEGPRFGSDHFEDTQLHTRKKGLAAPAPVEQFEQCVLSIFHGGPHNNGGVMGQFDSQVKRASSERLRRAVSRERRLVAELV